MVSAVGLGIGLACFGAATVAAQQATTDLAPEYQYVPDIFASEIPRGETVRTRQRPELDALGVHVGSFYLFPTIGNGISYNDNVFATPNNTKSDFLYTVSPALSVKSDWNQHSLSLAAGGNLGFYFDQDSENYKDAFATAAGSVNVSSNTILRGKAGLRREHEERSDPNSTTGASEPTVFYTYEAGLDGSHKFNRVTVSVGNEIRYFDYQDVDAASGGTIDSDTRDYVQLRPGVKVAYEFSPGYSGFVRGEGDFRNYNKTVDSAGFKRDSKGYDLVGGASIDLTGLLFGDFFAGVRQRYFDDSRFDSITGPVVGAKLTWIPTGLTTVNFDVENQIIESANASSSGYSSSAIGVSVDHELLRNLILSAGAGFRYDDFEGITRTDKFFTGRVGAEYLWNRYLSLGARYTFQNRDSDASGGDYTRNLFALSLTAKL